MQILKPSTMALIVNIISLFTSLNLAENPIGNLGCKYFSQAKWAHLK